MSLGTKEDSPKAAKIQDSVARFVRVSNRRKGHPMSKIVYVQRPEGIEPPQHIWVREPDQSVPSPDEPADYRLDATHPHFPLTNEAEVRAWIQYMFHPGIWEALTDIRIV
jgi:hypothetical protein